MIVRVKPRWPHRVVRKKPTGDHFPARTQPWHSQCPVTRSSAAYMEPRWSSSSSSSCLAAHAQKRASDRSDRSIDTASGLRRPAEVPLELLVDLVAELVTHDDLRDGWRDGEQLGRRTGAGSRQRVLEEHARVNDQDRARPGHLIGFAAER